MQQEIITAIDFGSEKLSASVVKSARDEEIQVLCSKSLKSKGFEKGILVDVKECREAVKNLLQSLEEKSGEPIYEVSIGITSRKIRLVQKSVPIKVRDGKLSAKDVKETLESYKNIEELQSNECIIDKIANNIIVDGECRNLEDSCTECTNAEINLTLVLGDIDEISKYYEVFLNTKYKIKYVIPNILAGKQIFLSHNELDGECALVDVGAGDSDIAIFNSECVPVSISSVPLGGNSITNDISICTNISLDDAEKLKRTYSGEYKKLFSKKQNEEELVFDGKNIPKKLVFEVINLRIQEILNHINMQLKNTGHYDSVCSIILYGDGVSYFEDIKELVDNIFSTRTKVVTGSDLGMKNSENITSLALVKEVYDRLYLLGYDEDIPSNKHIEQLKVDETESLHYNEDENRLFEKVKRFFSKIF